MILCERRQGSETQLDEPLAPSVTQFHNDGAKLVAFVDESCKPVRDPSTGRASLDRYRYVLACAVVLEADIAVMRLDLSTLEHSLGKPLHYRKMGRNAREAALTHISQLDMWDGALFEKSQTVHRQHHSEHHVRAKLLQRALTSLSNEFGVAEIVIESRSKLQLGPGQLDQKDHQVLRRLRGQGLINAIRLRHDDKSEIMLTLSDLLAGARTDHLCGVNRTAFALIANRVQAVARWPDIAP